MSMLILQIFTLLMFYNNINNVASISERNSKIKNLDAIAIKNFQTYLRIPSFQPDVNYGKFLSLRKLILSLLLSK